MPKIKLPQPEKNKNPKGFRIATKVFWMLVLQALFILFAMQLNQGKTFDFWGLIPSIDKADQPSEFWFWMAVNVFLFGFSFKQFIKKKNYKYDNMGQKY